MKNFLQALFFGLLILPLAHADELPASLKVNDALRLKASSFLTHHDVDLGSGPITIETEEQGLLLGSAFTLRTPDKSKFKFSVPKNAFTPAKSLPKGESLEIDAPADRTGQKVGLKLRVNDRNLESWQEVRRVKCSYTCYKNECGFQTGFDGKSEYSCGMRRSSCYDKQDAVLTFQKVERKMTGELTDAEGKSVATLEPVPHYDVLRVARRNVSSCGGKAPASAYQGLKSTPAPAAEAASNQPGSQLSAQ